MNQAEGSTVIGKTVVIRGELSGEEDLYMDGDIEGSISLAENRLTIGPHAKVVADVHARDIVIFGSLKGNINATGRVDLRQSAQVIGDILANRLSIEENATLKGRVELTAATATSNTTPTSSVTRAQTAAPSATGRPA
jgi:cytoskeletal protein CcmA (bactofilin family)